MILSYLIIQLLIILNNLKTIFNTKIKPLIKQIKTNLSSKNKKVNKIVKNSSK